MRPSLTTLSSITQLSSPRDQVATSIPPKPIVNEQASYKSMLLDEMNKNKNKNFVQRILRPNDFPNLPLSNGKHATHLMAWGEADGNYFVFPTVVQDPKTKKLIHLEEGEAFDYAIKNNEYMKFKDALSAAMISKDYKKLWEGK
jgi:hypothetical protein